MSMDVTTSLPVPDFDRFSRRAWGFLFGQDIQIVREEKGLSLEETARRAGMTVERWDAYRGRQGAGDLATDLCDGEGLEEEPIYGGVPGDPLCGGLGGRPGPSRRDYATVLITG